MGLTIEPPGPAISSGGSGASVYVHGTVTSPGAGVNIAAIGVGSLVSGDTYQVDAYVYIDGTTAAATDDDNMKIGWNGVTIGIIPVNANSVNQAPYKFTVPVTSPWNGTSALEVQSIAAGTTGAVYHVTIVATPLGA